MMKGKNIQDENLNDLKLNLNNVTLHYMRLTHI